LEDILDKKRLLSSGDKEEAVAEALIRQRVEDYANAISAKNIDGAMSFFAPNLVSFDIAIKTLRYVGADNKRRAWETVFATYRSISYEIRDLNVTTHGDLAFVHAVNHVNGTLANGHSTDMWVRWTACLRQIDGVWLVVHDHVSVPADLEHGQAVLNLTP
jgi:ketosteroid isomerase-like protein